jgi:tRNA 2-selenouridine synthase SelU
MGKRVTIVLEDDVDKRLHRIQTDFFKEYKDPISFSKVLNEILHKGLLKK